MFAVGYNALTMDALAHELGMSKKTLYAHFQGKDAIVAAIIDAAEQKLRDQIDKIVADPEVSFTHKLHGVIIAVSAQYAAANPLLLRDLQRFAPHLYRKVDELRSRLLPRNIGRLLHAGVAEGMVQKDIEPDFAVQFLLQAVTGLVRPKSLDQLGLTPREAFEKAAELFFWAVLTEAGRKDFAEARPRTG